MDDKIRTFQECYFTKNIQHPLFVGFGDDIDWVPWENAVETALDANKPIFLLIHKTWCHACKGLSIYCTYPLFIHNF